MCQTPVLSAASEEFRFSNPEAIQARLFFGTTTVQLSERENGALLLSDTRSSTWSLYFHSSGPWGRRFKSSRPDQIIENKSVA